MARLDTLMLKDRQRFARRLHGAKKVKNPDALQAIFAELEQQINDAAGKVQLRLAARPAITYPDTLPVSQKKDDILAAVRDNQVVIVAGGNRLGENHAAAKNLYGARARHNRVNRPTTQPRRLAARTVANRIAEELNTEPGGAVGL
ncbi:ATP-dependent helicase HrpA [Atlantibacter hermannii]|nr:ATP-dependent helicase HrpA [Atlantibacter hermannii]